MAHHHFEMTEQNRKRRYRTAPSDSARRTQAAKW